MLRNPGRSELERIHSLRRCNIPRASGADKAGLAQNEGGGIVRGSSGAYDGSSSRVRTYDLAVNSRTLCQLSYRGFDDSGWNIRPQNLLARLPNAPPSLIPTEPAPSCLRQHAPRCGPLVARVPEPAHAPVKTGGIPAHLRPWSGQPALGGVSVVVADQPRLAIT